MTSPCKRPPVSLVAMSPQVLLAVPNVSEGRDERTILAVGQAFAAVDGAGSRPEDAVRLLDVHSDADHHRSVFTIAGPPVRLADAVLAGARAAVERIDVIARLRLDPSETGQHPHVGALDVAPVVYLDEAARGAACAEALVIADRIGAELGVPVFLYGELTGPEPGSARTRAELRRGGAAGLAERGSAPPAAGRVCGLILDRRGCTPAPARRWSPQDRRWSRSTCSWPLPRRWVTPRGSPPLSVRAARRVSRACARSASR